MQLINRIREFFKAPVPQYPTRHFHEWVFKYKTGSYWTQQDEYYECACGAESCIRNNTRYFNPEKRGIHAIDPETHRHDWHFRYRTGNAMNGQSTVYECECGKFAVQHYGSAEYVLLKD